VHHTKRAPGGGGSYDGDGGDDGGEGATESEIIIYLEEAPPSRHINPTPSACFQVLKNFRQVTFQDRLVGEGEAAGAGGGQGGSGREATTAATATATATATMQHSAAGAAGGMLPLACLPLPLAEGGSERSAWETMAAEIFNLPAERLGAPLVESNSLSPPPPPQPSLSLMSLTEEEIGVLLDAGSVLQPSLETSHGGGSKPWCAWEDEGESKMEREGENGEDGMLTVPILDPGVLPHIFED
jgi:hypothetical protein